MLRDQLGPDDVLFSGQRISDRDKDHEIDIGVAFADGGIVDRRGQGQRGLVRGRRTGGSTAAARRPRIHPVKQAREAQYALRAWLDQDPRWGRPHRPALGSRGRAALHRRRRRLRAARRPALAGRRPLRPPRAGDVPARRGRPADERQAAARPRRPVRAAWTRSNGRGLPQRDLIGAAAEREDDGRTAQRRAGRDPRAPPASCTGSRSAAAPAAARPGSRSSRPAGSRREGQRVALTCYSRGLAAWLRATGRDLPAQGAAGVRRHVPRPRRRVGRADRPRGRQRLLGGRAARADGRPRRAAARRASCSTRSSSTRRRTSPTSGGPPLLAALKDEDDRRPLRVLRRGPAGLLPVRRAAGAGWSRWCSTTTCATPGRSPASFSTAGADPDAAAAAATVRTSGSSSARADEALDVAEDQVDVLLDGGLAPRGRRAAHHRQPAPRAEGAAGGRPRRSYWDTFWDEEQVFYGHVLGFKGLERPAVDPGAQRDRAGRAVPGAAVRRAVPRPRPARRGGGPGVRRGGRGTGGAASPALALTSPTRVGPGACHRGVTGSPQVGHWISSTGAADWPSVPQCSQTQSIRLIVAEVVSTSRNSGNSGRTGWRRRSRESGAR